MRRLAGAMIVVWLVGGCTVPDLEDLSEDKAYSCNAEHPCAEGYSCVQGACLATAVLVEVTYTFKAGCISVQAQDKAVPDKQWREDVAVLERGPSIVNIPVFRQVDWGSTIEITTRALEQSCDGVEVARESRSFTLDKKGVQKLSIVLSAPDEDEDGYVATSAGGTDCDDTDAESNPGVAAEVCDGRDNDCRNGVDDGLSLMEFFRDADADGVGAGPEMMACAAPVGFVAVSGDCDDTNGARTPGKAEICDEQDNDCDIDVDEGLPTSPYHRDADGDGVGLQADVMQGCRAPVGYVAPTAVFDCNDGNAAVKPGATELCNDMDDNCVNGIDESFPQKGTACTNDVCSGQYLCNGAQTDTVCNAPAPVSYYPDGDGDGEGATSATAQKVCAPSPAPAGKVANNTDCDDTDPHNRGGGSEVCDDRDNNCVSGKDDETAVCGGKGWKQLTDPLSTSRNWNTVAVGAGGEPVWIAGDSGALAVRLTGSTTFLDRNQQCGNTRWNASWVRPSNGQVFLAGDGGNLATYNAISACTTSSTANGTGGASSRPLLGIVGFEVDGVATVYVVNDEGHVFEWTPGSNPVFEIKRSGAYPFRDVHGRAASQLLLAGGRNSGEPEIHGYNANTSMLGMHQIAGAGNLSSKILNGVWAWDSTHAYAVGSQGLLLRWNGSSTWDVVELPGGMGADLTSVVAFDDSSVYVTDAVGGIRRAAPTGWVVHYSGSVPLKDIAASSPQNIWGVGGGTVVHFPEG